MEYFTLSKITVHYRFYILPQVLHIALLGSKRVNKNTWPSTRFWGIQVSFYNSKHHFCCRDTTNNILLLEKSTVLSTGVPVTFVQPHLMLHSMQQAPIATLRGMCKCNPRSFCNFILQMRLHCIHYSLAAEHSYGVEVKQKSINVVFQNETRVIQNSTGLHCYFRSTPPLFCFV